MKKILVLLPLLLIACTSPETPQQAVYLAESQYSAALRVELAYSNLPRCNKTTSKLCSDAVVIKKARKADDIAWLALQEAETAVRTQGYGKSSITTAVASAKALVGAFVSITSNLKTK